MRIRRSATTSSVSPSSCSSSSSSSCFSSSQHSTISSHSPTSSSNSASSSSSFSPSLSLSSSRRCEGLDLLVKAMFHVDGSVVGVPYIQRRIVRRRKPALKFANLVIASDHKLNLNLPQNVLDDVVVVDEEDDDEVVVDCRSKHSIKVVNKRSVKKQKQKKRSKAVPVKYQDSLLQSWKPRRRSSKV